VAADDIANDAVTTAKLATGAVDSARIANGAVHAEDIAGDAVRSATIQDGQVATADLAGGAVTGAKVENGSLGIADFAASDGASGTLIGSVPVSPTSWDPGCTAITATGISGVQIGDRVILNADAALDPRLILQPLVQTAPNVLTFRVCNIAQGPITTTGAPSVAYVVIR
jgi:hypothetical protein